MWAIGLTRNKKADLSESMEVSWPTGLGKVSVLGVRLGRPGEQMGHLGAA